MNSLIAQVDTELARCEAIIERRLKTFIEVGEALATIRNKGLLLQDQKPFEDYCQDRWGGFIDLRARQIMDAAEMVAALPIGTAVPIKEGHVHHLTGLSPETAAPVMTKASDTEGQAHSESHQRGPRHHRAQPAPEPVPTGQRRPAGPSGLRRPLGAGDHTSRW